MFYRCTFAWYQYMRSTWPYIISSCVCKRIGKVATMLTYLRNSIYERCLSRTCTMSSYTVSENFMITWRCLGYRMHSLQSASHHHFSHIPHFRVIVVWYFYGHHVWHSAVCDMFWRDGKSTATKCSCIYVTVFEATVFRNFLHNGLAMHSSRATLVCRVWWCVLWQGNWILTIMTSLRYKMRRKTVQCLE